MKRQLLSGLLAVVLLMTGCSGGSNSAGTKETGTTQDITQEAEETASQEATQISEQGEEQTPAEGTDTQQAAKGIRGMSASEFEPIESENGNIVILYTNDVHCAVDAVSAHTPTLSLSHIHVQHIYRQDEAIDWCRHKT